MTAVQAPLWPYENNDDDEDVDDVDDSDDLSYIACFQHLASVTGLRIYVRVTPRCQTISPLGHIKLKLELKTPHSLFFQSLSLSSWSPLPSSTRPITHLPLSTEDPKPLCNPIRTLFREIKLNKLWCEPNPNRDSYIRMRLLHRWMALGMDMDSQGLYLFSLPLE